jgi:hypothetical protein
MTKSRMRIGLSIIRAVFLLVENNLFVIYIMCKRPYWCLQFTRNNIINACRISVSQPNSSSQNFSLAVLGYVVAMS